MFTGRPHTAGAVSAFAVGALLAGMTGWLSKPSVVWKVLMFVLCLILLCNARLIQAGGLLTVSVFHITLGAPFRPLSIITFLVPVGTFLNPVATWRVPVCTLCSLFL